MPTINDPRVFVRRTGALNGYEATDYNDVAAAAEANDFSEKSIRMCCEGHFETLGGYKFEFRRGIPKRPGNHYVPDDTGETAKYECDECFGETTEYHNGICADCARGINEPDVLVCADTGVAYVRIDGDVFVKVDDIEDRLGSPEIHDGWYLSSIGNIPIEPPVPKVNIDAFLKHVLKGVDGPDDPGSEIATMITRKVRRVASGVVYDNCVKAAEAIECEPWRIHADATNNEFHASGELWDWVDDNTASDGSADYARKVKPTECDICDSDDDCPDFENFPWVW